MHIRTYLAACNHIRAHSLASIRGAFLHFCFVSANDRSHHAEIFQPWSAGSIAKSRIDATAETRRRRFEQARARSEDVQEDVRKRILSLHLFELRDALAAETYSASTVLKAYMLKALEVNERLNCLIDVLLEAFEKAERLDAEYSASGAKKPPLFGLPFSVKGNFYVRNFFSSSSSS